MLIDKSICLGKPRFERGIGESKVAGLVISFSDKCYGIPQLHNGHQNA